MKVYERKHIRIRLVIVGSALGIFLLIIVIKAFYLQVFCDASLSEEAANQYKRAVISRGKRGIIYDKNYREMAVSIDMTSIAAYPRKISNVHNTAVALAQVLGVKKSILVKRLSSKKRFVWVKRKVTPAHSKSVRALKLAGIDFIPEHKRFYPNKTLAAQILGFSGIDGHGLEGLEFYYDNYLQGVDNRFVVLKDAFGRCFAGGGKTGRGKESAGSHGNNLILTIDSTVQYITESALEEGVTQFAAKSGIAIVMIPETGAVLALAHYPFFNPNAFNSFDRKVWRNRAVTDPFEPGSTLKIFSAAGALESGNCTPNTIFFCENGKYRIGRNTIHDTHPHGWLSLQQIIKYSSNIGTVKVSEMMGSECLYLNLRKFGFGGRTGLDCPGETSGCLSNYRRWSRIDASTISFGQGISISAIQMVSAAAAIANNGILMKPYLVQAVTDHAGRLVKSFEPEKKRRVVSVKTAKKIQRIMKTVSDEKGTGSNAAIEGYSVCGKTGTAQKVDSGGKYAKGKYMASFIGFFPAKKPAIVIFVIIDEPQDMHYGGVVAAPVFKKIALETVEYMNIPPEIGSGGLMALQRAGDEK